MAMKSGGGDNTTTASAKFNLPHDDSDDDDSLHEHEEFADNEEIRQKIVSTLNDVFTNDLQIHVFQTVDDNIQEVWVNKRPKIVFNYLFGNEIGNGSYGKVKEVLHFKTHTRRAIKIIKDKKVGKIPNGISNVQREFIILRQLDHPNIIRLIESFRVESKAKLYLVFEYCLTSLGYVLDNAPLKLMNEYQAHYYFDQLIAGLEYLHIIGIIHKDIKPSNLLITEENTLKIADFGVAEKLDNPENDLCTMSPGTPAFQAPEVCTGDSPTFKGRCIDIWATGISLFRMTTGVYPFEGNNLMKLFDDIIKEPFIIPVGVILSKDLIDLISGMLLKCPDERWTLKRIREASWMTKVHSVDNENLIPLPEADHSVFDELLDEIEENPNEVDYVDDAHPFSGIYPSSVIDRTLQTPSSKFPDYKTVECVDDNEDPHTELQPTRLEFNTSADGEITMTETPANSPLVVSSYNNSHPSKISPSSNSQPPQQQQPRRHHKRGLFSCFRATSDNSPE